MDFPGGSDSKESACNAGDLGLIPGLYMKVIKQVNPEFSSERKKNISLILYLYDMMTVH